MAIRILIYYIFTFFFTMLLGGLQQATGVLPQIILPQWGPGIAGLLMLLFFRKDKHSITCQFQRGQIKEYLLSIAYPILITAVGVAFFVFILNGINVNQLTLLPSIVLLGSTLLGSIGEEIGWRGYLQPTLSKKMNLFWSSLVVAALWAPWHVGNFTYGLEFLIGFMLAILGYTFFISYLIKDTKFNLVIAILFHWFINLANSVVPITTLTTGRFMLTVGVTWAVAALILIIIKRKAFQKKANED
jgi:uncharacterized protein